MVVSKLTTSFMADIHTANVQGKHHHPASTP